MKQNYTLNISIDSSIFVSFTAAFMPKDRNHIAFTRVDNKGLVYPDGGIVVIDLENNAMSYIYDKTTITAGILSSDKIMSEDGRYSYRIEASNNAFKLIVVSAIAL